MWLGRVASWRAWFGPWLILRTDRKQQVDAPVSIHAMMSLLDGRTSVVEERGRWNETDESWARLA